MDRLPGVRDFWLRRLRAVHARAHKLRAFFWEATLRCNLSCRHCGSDCRAAPDVPDLEAATVLEVFRDIAAHYDPRGVYLLVTGGEPLVRPDLFEILGEARAMGFSWGMVTNGLLVDEETVRRCLETGMRTVSVSVDGLEASHNWMRGHREGFARSMRALRLFREAGCFEAVEAITSVGPRALPDLEELHSRLRSMYIRHWRLLTIFPKGRARIHRDLVVSAPLLREVLAFIRRKRAEDPGLSLRYSEEGYLGEPWEGTVRPRACIRCSAGIHIGGLMADGSYSSCPSLSPEWAQGKVGELPFSEAWETRYANMRDRRWMRTGLCENCPQWKNCFTPGLHLWNWKEQRFTVCHRRMLRTKERNEIDVLPYES